MFWMQFKILYEFLLDIKSKLILLIRTEPFNYLKKGQ